MYRRTEKQREFVEFMLPFGGKLLSSNRWVKMSQLIPWHQFEDEYCSKLSKSGQGPPAFSVRMALAALIIKERLGLSDEECVEQIHENPYLQYFCGLKQFTTETPFHPTMYVHFRKRFPSDVINRINEIIVQKAVRANRESNGKNSGKGNGKSGPKDAEAQKENQGKLLMDATCVPADITFPTDLKLLSAAREKTEEIIDVLHKGRGKGYKKRRTYRKKARKAFLAIAKSNKIQRAKLRKAIRSQLGFIRRNLKSIEKLVEVVPLTVLSKRQYRDLLVISELYRQQQWMHDHRSKRIDDRIVSLSQPHVRPIKRGKASSNTEFGPKISVSLVGGYGFVDRTSWDNFNESGDLKDQVEAYKRRFGIYPKSVHADKL